MDLLPLKYFQKAAKLQHLTRAAEDLHITQPALSQTIARLEKELGVTLFDRVGRQIKLNRFGQAFLRHVDMALSALDEGKREITDRAGLERGAVSVDTTFLPEFAEEIQKFRNKYPDVQFEVSTVNSKKQKEQLLVSGEVDFSILCRTTENPEIQHVPVRTEAILLIVPYTHPLAKQDEVQLCDLSQEAFIHFKPGHSFREDTDQLCHQAGFVPEISCEVQDGKTLVELVESGLGIAFWLESLVKPTHQYHVLQLIEPECSRTYYLSWKKDRYLSKAAQAFREALTKCEQSSST